MATANISINSTYTLVTTETAFVAQNRHHLPQEWARAASAPAETVVGLNIEPKQGMDGESGTGNLYVRGDGIVVVVS